MARVRDAAPGTKARGRCERWARGVGNRREREAVESWRHLAQEPCAIAPGCWVESRLLQFEESLIDALDAQGFLRRGSHILGKHHFREPLAVD